MPNFAVLLVKNAADNPEGLPLEWYRDVRGPVQALDPSLQAVGYQLMTDVEMSQRQVTFGAEYQNYLTVTAATKESTNNAKIKALKDLFDAGDVLDAKRLAGTATASDLRDLGVIGWQIARLTKRQILDQYRP